MTFFVIFDPDEKTNTQMDEQTNWKIFAHQDVETNTTLFRYKMDRKRKIEREKEKEIDWERVRK